jgi:hypothetical protein
LLSGIACDLIVGLSHLAVQRRYHGELYRAEAAHRFVVRAGMVAAPRWIAPSRNLPLPPQQAYPVDKPAPACAIRSDRGPHRQHADVRTRPVSAEREQGDVCGQAHRNLVAEGPYGAVVYGVVHDASKRRFASADWAIECHRGAKSSKSRSDGAPR